MFVRVSVKVLDRLSLKTSEARLACDMMLHANTNDTMKYMKAGYNEGGHCEGYSFA